MKKKTDVSERNALRRDFAYIAARRERFPITGSRLEKALASMPKKLRVKPEKTFREYVP